LVVKALIRVGLGAAVLLSSLHQTLPAVAQVSLAASRLCNSGQVQRFNTGTQGETIILGRQTGRRYVVVVPYPRSNTLDQVRQCVSDAFLTESRLGPYIHAGAFSARSRAESLAQLLRNLGIDARVAYF